MIRRFKLVILFILTILSLQTYSAYPLAAGDSIRIAVYGEEGLSFEEYLIDGSESIDYPYLGKIDLHDITVRGLQERITKGLRGDYLIDPKVTVNIVKYRNFYVNGVVNQPGGYQYQPGLTIQKAIALSGGFIAKYRKTKGIYLTKDSETRGLSQDQIKELLKDKPEAELNDEVGPGDTIYVVSSFW